MAKIKVHEIAKEFDIKSSEVIAVLAGMGIEGKAPASGLEDDQAEAVRKALSKKSAPAKKEAAAEAKPAPAKEPAAKPAAAKPAGARPAGARPAGERPQGAVPVKKKKPIIVVSSARNAQGGRGQSPAGGQRGPQSGSGPRQGGIIRPTVPTTAERAARLAESNQGGDKDRLRRAGTTPKKETQETGKTDINTAGSGSGSTGSAAGSAGAQRPAETEQRPARPARTEGERPAGGRSAAAQNGTHGRTEEASRSRRQQRGSQSRDRERRHAPDRR